MAKAPATTKSAGALVASDANLPSYLQGRANTGSGLVGLDANDIVIPRIKLLQKISSEPDEFEAAKAGIFWLNVLDQPLGYALEFIVVSNRKRYVLQPPLGSQPDSIFARSEDGKVWNTLGEWTFKMRNVKDPVTWKIDDLSVRGSGLTEFGTAIPGDPDSKPAATLYYDYLVYLPAYPEVSPVVLSLARSQGRKAKDLNGKIEFRKQPMQAQKFQAGIVTETGAEGEYYNYSFKASGWASEEEFKGCVDLSERFKTYRVAEEEKAEGEVGGRGPNDSKDY